MAQNNLISGLLRKEVGKSIDFDPLKQKDYLESAAQN